MEKPYYVLKTSELFPYDAEQIDNKTINKIISEVFRPEFLCNYDFPLKADTHKDYQNISVGTNQNKFL
jgi:hypothetical protein